MPRRPPTLHPPGHASTTSSHTTPADVTPQRVGSGHCHATGAAGGSRGAGAVRGPAEPDVTAQRRAAAGLTRRARHAGRAREHSTRADTATRQSRAVAVGRRCPRALRTDPRGPGNTHGQLDLAPAGCGRPAGGCLVGARNAGRRSRPAADILQRIALDAALELPWSVAASPAALHAAGIPDAVPGLATILGAYVKTLPRVLVLTSSSAR